MSRQDRSDESLVPPRRARHGTRRPAHTVAAAAGPGRRPAYVALGDSYASGTGTRSYIADGTSCQRSTYAYPSLIAAARGYALNFRACSGAKVADVTSTQLCALTSATAYVTISVGGNDAGFADVITDLRAARWLSNCNGAVDSAQAYINTLPGVARHPLHLDPGQGAVRQGRRRRLPAHLQRRGLQRLHLVLAVGGVRAQPDRRPAQQQARGRRGRAGFAFANPTSPSSATPSATTPSGSTASPTRSARATTPTGHRARLRLHPARQPAADRRRRSRSPPTVLAAARRPAPGEQAALSSSSTPPPTARSSRRPSSPPTSPPPRPAGPRARPASTSTASSPAATADPPVAGRGGPVRWSRKDEVLSRDPVGTPAGSRDPGGSRGPALWMRRYSRRWRLVDRGA